MAAILRTGARPRRGSGNYVRAARRDHRHRERLREDDVRARTRRAARRPLPRARLDPLALRLARDRGVRPTPSRRPARRGRRVGDRRLVPRKARRPRARGGGHRRLARPAAAGLARAARPPDAPTPPVQRGALERQPGVAPRVALRLRAPHRPSPTAALASRARTLPRRATSLAGRGRRLRQARLVPGRATGLSDRFLSRANRAESVPFVPQAVRPLSVRSIVRRRWVVDTGLRRLLRGIG